MPRLL
jgi:hypothetical protein